MRRIVLWPVVYGILAACAAGVRADEPFRTEVFQFEARLRMLPDAERARCCVSSSPA